VVPTSVRAGEGSFPAVPLLTVAVLLAMAFAVGMTSRLGREGI